MTARSLATRRERDIQRAILDFLKTAPGVYAFKSGTGSFRAMHNGRERFVRIGKVGVADIIGWQTICAGVEDEDGIEWHRNVARFLAIEVKRPSKKPTPEQAAFLDAVRLAGGIGIVAHSVEEVAEALGLSRK